MGYQPQYEKPPKKPNHIKKSEEPKIENKGNCAKYVIGVLAILFIVYLLLNFSGTNLFFRNIFNYTEETLFQNFSLSKIHFFDNNTNLLENLNSKDGDNTDLSKPDIHLLEQKIHNLINVERQKHGLSQLTWNDKIALAARGHSEDMVKRNYFEHNSPEGHDFFWRYSQVGFNCVIQVGDYIYTGAENIYQGWTYAKIWYIYGIEVSRELYSLDEIAEDVVNGWMNSPGHRKNILTPYWRTEGIGVAVSSDGKVLVTQNFC